jgi:hypothetical protein
MNYKQIIETAKARAVMYNMRELQWRLEHRRTHPVMQDYVPVYEHAIRIRGAGLRWPPGFCPPIPSWGAP